MYEDYSKWGIEEKVIGEINVTHTQRHSLLSLVREMLWKQRDADRERASWLANGQFFNEADIYILHG